ncbi:MAG: nucleotidyl transferase AbiEii/AbiGii toxin family protein [Gammaproteobacteria bacterium]|nr:nucleotidyl transferase AbiEii/AbiGii toxin family protein [Gammaproteobacteria bacterium]
MSFTLGDWSSAIVAAAPGLGQAKRALESELLSMAVFDVIHRFALLPDDAVFIGGTALRLCHGSPRFSEDLDFHTPKFAPRTLDRGTLAVETEKITGCSISVSTPMGSGSTLARVSAEVPGRDRSQRRPRMKIDLGEGIQVDVRREIITLRMAGGLVPGMGDVGDAFSFRTSSKEELFADKHMALVGRKRRIKHRDLFDILWLRHRGVDFRPDIVAAKVAMDNRAGFAAILRQRAKAGRDAVSSGSYRAEMEHFLPSDSSWLFPEPKRCEGMAAGFETLILDHAKLVDKELSRTVTGPALQGGSSPSNRRSC